MPDLALIFGSDLEISLTGDLDLVDGGDYAVQRVLRRLLTNPGDYLWQPGYGAGLAAFIGQPTNANAIAGVSRAQMRLEATVATQPPPVVTIDGLDDGSVYESIQFVLAGTGETVTAVVPLTPIVLPSQHTQTGSGLLNEATFGTFDFR